VIAKEGSRWGVRATSGKLLGKHRTKKDAVRQLAAVEASKMERQRAHRMKKTGRKK